VTLTALRDEFHGVLPGERRFRAVGAVGDVIAGPLRLIAEEIFRKRARPVRLILFDKSADMNWNLGWHQDRVIAVAASADVEGFRNWTRKHGAVHVEPPFAFIERMITIRLHCDDCGPENGALEVLSGSHRLGSLNDEETAMLASASESTLLDCGAGDALVLATSIVHRSRPSMTAKRRRVIHVDFSVDDLPPPLQWAFAPNLAEC